MIKNEVHDIENHVHHTNNGSYPVEEYRRTAFGIYVRRRFVNHPTIKSWEAHILPERNLQICRYHPHNGRWWCKYYIDIVIVEDKEHTVYLRDLILDVAIDHDAQSHILDTDEFTEAIRDGTIDNLDVITSLRTAHSLVNDLARSASSLEVWQASHQVELTWQEGE